MGEPSREEMAAKLLAPAIDRDGPIATALTDPIADTPMVVTLEQLRPYDHDPRVTRNPRYDDIKASIRERGLDAPPPITRRPTDAHYIIRNGGNTRLAILRELWSETKDERFFRIACLFRPWSARGEIIALTGHLAENELRGNLSFIERALGVAKANELYEAESSTSLSQSELARRLTADGYPITQSHISRMQDTVRYLLPAIPTILYGGLGKHQIERLINLRKGASRVWESRGAANPPTIEFGALFQDVLASFDGEPHAFTVQRAQDELLGQMAPILCVDYDSLALEIIADSETRQLVLRHDPARLTSLIPPPPEPVAPNLPPLPRVAMTGASAPTPPPLSTRPSAQPTNTEAPGSYPTYAHAPGHSPPATPDEEERIAQHIVSPLQVTDRLHDIQRTIAAATGDTIPDFRTNVLQAIPVQAGGLHPISDIWYIEAGLDSQESLRVHIAQLAREIAAEAGADGRIQSVTEGIGFTVVTVDHSTAAIPFFERAVVSLLSALSTPHLTAPSRRQTDSLRLGDDLGMLLQGSAAGLQRRSDHLTRLSDVAIVKLFRLIRLARRLFELPSDHAT
ncbi:MAG: ParB family protein [Proteobacteria bacterium]|nr:ParB family protein [Pseudomonadota bacterium]